MSWKRRLRGAFGMALIWGGAGAFLGFLMEAFVDPHGRIADIWPAVLGFPGFFGGLFFSAVLSFTERHRRFDELSVARVGAWGALAGLLLGLFPFLIGDASGESPWLTFFVIVSSMTVLVSGLAAGSMALARRASDRELLDAATDVGKVGLTEGEAQELLGPGSRTRQTNPVRNP